MPARPWSFHRQDSNRERKKNSNIFMIQHSPPYIQFKIVHHARVRTDGVRRALPALPLALLRAELPDPWR